MIKSQREDIRYLRRCFTLAKRGAGYVSPNPLVGAVLVKNGKIIGEGWHQRYGGPHAEINAFKKCKTDPAGATLYVNLEPCCHTNKLTPPCTPLIISKKIKRVVVSNTDPNAQVSGKGLAQLQKAGIEVLSGVLRDEGAYLNRFFFHHTTTGLPYVIVKIARTLDGKISRSADQQTRITGEQSQKFVHRLRAGCDAVLIGAGTVRTDNPQLNVRNVKGKNPFRIVVDGNLSSPPEAKLIQTARENPTLIFTSNRANATQIKAAEANGIELIQLPADANGFIEPSLILNALGKRKITSLIVEGGNVIFSQFIGKRSFNELIVLQSPDLFGSGLNGFTSELTDRLILKSVAKLGNDVKMVFLKKEMT